MDMLGGDYDALGRVAGLQLKEAESKGDTEAAKHWKVEQGNWQGEAGVLAIGKGELQGVLPQYFEKIKQTPPSSTEELLKLESDSITRAYLGIGLEKTGEPEKGNGKTKCSGDKPGGGLLRHSVPKESRRWLRRRSLDDWHPVPKGS